MATRQDKITFPEFYVWGDSLQYILRINYTTDGLGGIYELNAEDLNLSINKYGKLITDYRLDERLLIPSQIEITFNDFDGEIESRIFDEDITDITVEIYLNGSAIYKAGYIETPLTSKPDEGTITIGFSSNTNILNTTMVKDREGNLVYPVDFSDLLITVTGASIPVVKVTDAIKRMYELINSEIEFEHYQDWIFYGIYETVDERQYTIEDATFDELYVKPSTMFYGCETLGDVLRKMAERFFCKTGLVNNSNAFFRKLYYYNSSNLQDITIVKRTKDFPYNTITYLASKDAYGNVAVEFPDADAYTTNEDDYIETLYTWDADDYYIVRSNTAYKVQGAKDPANGVYTFYEFSYLSSQQLYEKRSARKYNREDEHTVKGINVDYIKNYIDGNIKYEINTMIRDFDNWTTTLNSNYVGEI